MKKHNASNIESALETFIHDFFGTGTISEKTKEAEQLVQLKGLNIFVIPVPWYILLPDSKEIRGYSENMKTAVHDLYAQLQLLAKIYPSEINITLDIDVSNLAMTAPNENGAVTFVKA